MFDIIEVFSLSFLIKVCSHTSISTTVFWKKPVFGSFCQTDYVLKYLKKGHRLRAKYEFANEIALVED